MEDFKNIRERFTENERQTLSVYACPSSESRGRERPEPPCEIRTDFQRDRDRILHSQSFRRLMNKTQVFLAPTGDHYRTRMTHTLEVTQIARIIARALRLNEDLTEAAALGHDIGHTPFGHAGEYAMQKCFDPSFTHYRQSVRVVEKLEQDRQEIEEQKEYVQSDAYVEELAREKLGLVYKDEVIFEADEEQ